MRYLKTAMFLATAFVGFCSAPAMAAIAQDAAETRIADTRNDDDGRPVKKPKDPANKTDAKQNPKKEACRTCRILM